VKNIFTTALLFVLILGCSQKIDKKEPPIPIQDRQELKQKETDKTCLILLNLHNKERTKKGLKPLIIDEGLINYAQIHSNKMLKKDKLYHSNISSLLSEYEGYVGENIAYGQKDEESVVKAWMNSYSHRSNILGSYTKVGFGLAVEENRIYWCVVFAN
jgi:uncharacterized protein YkwD